MISWFRDAVWARVVKADRWFSRLTFAVYDYIAIALARFWGYIFFRVGIALLLLLAFFGTLLYFRAHEVVPLNYLPDTNTIWTLMETGVIAILAFVWFDRKNRKSDRVYQRAQLAWSNHGKTLEAFFAECKEIDAIPKGDRERYEYPYSYHHALELYWNSYETTYEVCTSHKLIKVKEQFNRIHAIFESLEGFVSGAPVDQVGPERSIDLLELEFRMCWLDGETAIVDA